MSQVRNYLRGNIEMKKGIKSAKVENTQTLKVPESKLPRMKVSKVEITLV